MPGPPPNPTARRRNARPGFLILPAEGYQGEVPEWPLATRQTQGERAAWESLWRTPQAAAWAQLQLARTVARYVRVLVKAERAGAKASLLSEVRQLEDRLGLTPMSMLRLRWEVAADETAEQRQARAAGTSRWAGLKVVDSPSSGSSSG